jgi:Ni/Co efflux regulator RcnB
MRILLTAGAAALLLASPSAFAQREPDHGTQIQLAQNDNHEVRGTPHWARGDRVPEEFRGDRYAVSDWNSEHLNRPPRGFHWVHVGDRFLLIADKTGLVRDFREEGEHH